MTARVIKSEVVNGRIYRTLFDPADGRTTVERITPPRAIQQHAVDLAHLKATAAERARKANGLYQVASITPAERNAMARAGVKMGDVDGLRWALKQDRWSHARVGK